MSVGVMKDYKHFVYYESIKREVSKRLICECRCDKKGVLLLINFFEGPKVKHAAMICGLMIGEMAAGRSGWRG